MRTIGLIVLGISIALIVLLISEKAVLPLIDATIHAKVYPEKDDGTGLTKEACALKGGVWRKPGPSPIEICQIPSSDGGKPCISGFQCEWGSCVSRLNLRSKIHLIGTGQCTTYHRVYGCVNFLSLGVVTRSVCLD